MARFAPVSSFVVVVTVLAGSFFVVSSADAQEATPVRIVATQVRGSVYMLEGQGGNMGLLVGSDGALLIDDQFAPLSEKIMGAIQAVTDADVRFLVNTHWHQDHTGGNENFGKAGAVIVAHENVRKRMSVEQFIEAFERKVPASPRAALPVVTFAESVRFHLNDEEVHVFHVVGAHTDGDSIIHFERANVFHLGDIYFSAGYPYVDTSSGGTFDGVIAAVDQVLAMANDETKLIPGHGPLTGIAELRSYRAVLGELRSRIVTLLEAGKTVDEIVAAKPSQDHDEQWGTGFMKPDQWVRIVTKSLASKRKDD